jgi:dTDP-4-dehydrorhamnose 3,5-epimerase
MKIEALDIEGAYKITPKKVIDVRGGFSRLYCSNIFLEHSLNTNWLQMNVSINNQKGIVRGLHYQNKPYQEIKLIRCVRGKVFDVIFDLRKNSRTFGKSTSLILNSKNLETVYVPQGCAHGFQTLTKYVELHYLHSEVYKPEYEAGIYFGDPALEINWPLTITSMSDRDKKHPLFSKNEHIKL